MSRSGTALGMSTLMATLIVPRGLSEEYYEFLAITAGANREQILIDRRRGSRRGKHDVSMDERRAGDDRRGPVPEMWTRDSLIVLR